MTKVDLCLVCIHEGNIIVGARRVAGQGPYCERHAQSWEQYLAEVKK